MSKDLLKKVARGEVSPEDATKILAGVRLAGQIRETLGQTVHKKVTERLLQMGLAGPEKGVLKAAKSSGKDSVQVAKENQRFYLEMQEMDSEADKKPWHHFPKEDKMYGELVFITPAMALMVLEGYNISNRKKIISQIEKYARDMVDGNWFETGESVQFDLHGNLVDGQHRLFALLLAAEIAGQVGIPFEGCPLFCVWNVPPAARFVVDSGANRPEGTKVELLFGDDLTIPKNSRNRQFFAICRAMMNGNRDRGSTVFSHSELAYFGEKYGKLIGEIMHDLQGAGSTHGIKRADVIAALTKAYLWHGREKVQPFSKRLGTILFDGKTDPAYLLYNLVHRGGATLKGVVLYKKTLAAIEHSLRGSQINKLRELEEDLFDWLPDWEVPNPANKGAIKEAVKEEAGDEEDE